MVYSMDFRKFFTPNTSLIGLFPVTALRGNDYCFRKEDIQAPFYRSIIKISVTSKGSIEIPAYYLDFVKQHWGLRMVATRALGPSDRCLWLYPRSVWYALLSGLRKQAYSSTQIGDVYRYLIANAKICAFDNGGCIDLPNGLRKLARLENNAILAWVGNKFEIWDERLFVEPTLELDDKSASKHRRLYI